MCNNTIIATRHANRPFTVPLIAFVSLLLLCLFFPSSGAQINFSEQLLAPSFEHWFGTDWLGRDQFSRTLSALLLSLSIGIGSALLSALIALSLALLAGMSRKMTWLVDLIVDAMMSVPHLLLLIILVLAFGGGANGVIFAVALSHWPRLTRLLCDEIHALKQCHFVVLSSQFGQSRFRVLFLHVMPFLIPHWLTALLLTVPHTLLHVAGLTFLGFGLEPTTASIGVLLADSTRYIITGHWWLALFPGLVLLITLLLLSTLAQRLVTKIKQEGI